MVWLIFWGNVAKTAFDGGILFPLKNEVQVPSWWSTWHISPILGSILMYWVLSSVVWTCQCLAGDCGGGRRRYIFPVALWYTITFCFPPPCSFLSFFTQFYIIRKMVLTAHQNNYVLYLPIDNLGSLELGGFKESCGSAYRTCRHCMATQATARSTQLNTARIFIYSDNLSFNCL